MTTTKPELQRAPSAVKKTATYERCANCRYWIDQGYCQRFPPTVVVLDDEAVGRWPAVGENNWCGEFKP